MEKSIIYRLKLHCRLLRYIAGCSANRYEVNERRQRKGPRPERRFGVVFRKEDLFSRRLAIVSDRCVSRWNSMAKACVFLRNLRYPVLAKGAR